jgi:hypothetical protein
VTTPKKDLIFFNVSHLTLSSTGLAPKGQRGAKRQAPFYISWKIVDGGWVLLGGANLLTLINVAPCPVAPAVAPSRNSHV